MSKAIFPSGALTDLWYASRLRDSFQENPELSSIYLDSSGYLVAADGYILVARRPRALLWEGKPFSAVIPLSFAQRKLENHGNVIADGDVKMISVMCTNQGCIQKILSRICTNEGCVQRYWHTESLEKWSYPYSQWQRLLPCSNNANVYRVETLDHRLLSRLSKAMGTKVPLLLYTNDIRTAGVTFSEERDFSALGMIMPRLTSREIAEAFIGQTDRFLRQDSRLVAPLTAS